jgi:hypothetical protein
VTICHCSTIPGYYPRHQPLPLIFNQAELTSRQQGAVCNPLRIGRNLPHRESTGSAGQSLSWYRKLTFIVWRRRRCCASSTVPDEAVEEAEPRRPTIIKWSCQLSSRPPVTLHLHFRHGLLLSWTAGSIRGHPGLRGAKVKKKGFATPCQLELASVPQQNMLGT